MITTFTEYQAAAMETAVYPRVTRTQESSGGERDRLPREGVVGGSGDDR